GTRETLGVLLTGVARENEGTAIRGWTDMTIATLIESLLGADLPVAFRAYDGGSWGPADAETTIVIRSPDALRRLVTAPGELGIGRAYVAGDIDLEGDAFAALELRHRMPRVQ